MAALDAIVIALFACAYLSLVGYDAALGMEWAVWYGGIPFPRRRFYGAVLLHPDTRLPRRGTWRGGIRFLGRDLTYHGDYRRIGGWMLLWSAPKREHGFDLALGGAGL